MEIFLTRKLYRTAFELRTQGETTISDLSTNVKELLRRNISSVHQLEVLLLLKRYTDRKWLAREIGQELYTNATAASDELERLASLGFFEVSEDGNAGERRYRYHAKSHDLDAAVIELASAYRNYRVRVIDAIFSRPQDNLRNFSDAFRLGKEESEAP